MAHILANIAKVESKTSSLLVKFCRNASIYMSVWTNIAKVESRGKINFGLAETAASTPLAFSQNIDYICNP